MDVTTTDQPSTILPPSLLSRWERNRAALAQTQPDVVDRLDETRIHSNIRFVPGRDGSECAQLQDHEAKWRWLGGSSMPTISAAAVFSSFVSESTSVVVPGILTGIEPIVLAGKIPPHTAVFVLEDDPLLVKLALHLHDYHELFTSGRLVLILGPDYGESLCRFVRKHPGYELPSTMVKVPQRTPAEFADMQRRLEAAGAEVAGVVLEALQRSTTALQDRPPCDVPANPAVAVVGVDPRPSAISHAQQLAGSAEALGWQVALSVPDAPSHCHAISRLDAIASCRADFVVIASGTAGSLRGNVPPNCPMVSWFAPFSVLPESLDDPPGPRDVAVVATRSQHQQLVRLGWPASKVRIESLTFDDACFRPIRLSPADQRRMNADVALLADIPDDRPESCGITLTSHVPLWDSLRQLVAGAAASRLSPDVEDLLRQAETECGVQITDDGLRDRLLALARQRVLPAAVGRAVMSGLDRRVLRVGVWGNGWRDDQGNDADDADLVAVRGPIPDSDERNILFQSVPHIVLLSATPTNMQFALEAWSVGATVHIAGDAAGSAREFPSLADIIPHLSWWSSAAQLGERLLNVTGRVLLSADDADDRIPRRKQLFARHTLRDRLIGIRDRLRKTGTAATV